jgi:hypothetical protein
MKWQWKLKHGKAIGPFYMSMKWKLKHRKPIDPLLYVYDVWKFCKENCQNPINFITIHNITIIVSLCVICIIKLNHLAKLLCIMKINLLVGRSLKASQHLGSWNSNTKPKLM